MLRIVWEYLVKSVKIVRYFRQIFKVRNFTTSYYRSSNVLRLFFFFSMLIWKNIRWQIFIEHWVEQEVNPRLFAHNAEWHLGGWNHHVGIKWKRFGTMCWWVPDMTSPKRSTGHVNNGRVTSNTKRHIDPSLSSAGLPQRSVSLLFTYQCSALICMCTYIQIHHWNFNILHIIHISSKTMSK